MAIIEHVSFDDMVIRAKAIGRYGQFSPRAWETIYEYLGELSEDIELDIVGICCEFREYGSLEEFLDDHDCPHYDPDASHEENMEAVESWLMKQTSVPAFDEDMILFIDY